VQSLDEIRKREAAGLEHGRARSLPLGVRLHEFIMDAPRRTIGDLDFWLVGQLQLRRTPQGRLVEYMHNIPSSVRQNAYAAGPFCHFSLPQAPRAEGVYAIFVGGELVYIGEAEDLMSRFSATGYGQISPRNLHHDGQGTNCKLNSRVLAAAKDGKTTEVWFHSTTERKVIEARLIREADPPWNGRLPSGEAQRGSLRAKRPGSRSATDPLTSSARLTTQTFRDALQTILRDAERQSQRSIRVRAGDLHRVVGRYPGDHRMPMCCAAMRSLMSEGDTFVYQPPRGNGANLEIEYQLPRSV